MAPACANEGALFPKRSCPMKRERMLRAGSSKRRTVLALALFSLLFAAPRNGSSQAKPFNVMEATIEEIHAAYKAGRLTSHQLVQFYLDRIEAYDKKGPNLHSIITINSKALKDADKLDAAFKASGFVGPLHGIPV